MSFVHLCVHSNFSMLAGTRPVEDLVRAAAAAGMPAVALTDTDGMYAVVPFQRACGEAGLWPIHGVELTGALDVPGQSRAAGGHSLVRVTLLARTRDGYGELSRV
ncbi:MAG TPA: PHP domain-containing protein, partial [Candidatus Krumholzibacteriaceae bacterium]